LHSGRQGPYTVNLSNRVDLMVSGRLSPQESTTSTPRLPDPGVRVPRARASDIVQLAEQAGDILARAREAALAPGTKKVLRKFNLKEVAELVGVSAKTITRAVQRNELPPGERVRGNRLLFTLQEIHEIQDRLGLKPSRDPATDKPVVIAIANFKGGVGKTSTAIHLGQYFALRGYRVLMIDLDAQASLTTLFGLLPDSEVATDQTALPYLEGVSDTLATAIQPTYWHGLDLIAANLALYGAEFSLANRQKSEPNFRFYQALKAGIATVSDRYDVIVIDTPPALSYVTTNALYAADGIIVPVPPAMMDFASASLFFSLLGDIQKVIDENEGGEKVFDFLGLLISKYEPGNFVHQTIHDWVRAAFQQRVLFHTMGTSTVLRMGPEIQTAYEVGAYQGDRRTLSRALEYLEGVNGEIERLVRAQWPSKSGPRLVQRPERASTADAPPEAMA
jgi:chromosome partitioning protein